MKVRVKGKVYSIDNIRFNIRKYMKRKGYTRKRLCVESGVAESTLRGYLDSGNTPRLTALVDIAGVLGCTLNDLLAEETEEHYDMV